MSTCDICSRDTSTRDIEGTRICETCFKTVQLIRNDNLDAIRSWALNPPPLMTAQGSLFVNTLISKKIELVSKDDELRAIAEDPNILDFYAIRFYLERRVIVLPLYAEPIEFSFDDVVDYELLEDGATVGKGGVGRAIVGGLLAGGAGAIVGSTTRKSKNVCTSLVIKITVRGRGAEYATFINSETDKSSMAYKRNYTAAQDALSRLMLICKEQEETVQEHGSAFPSKADEILKLKNLLDDGVLTHEEFDYLKQEVIGMPLMGQ